jgi:hypothetical protein
MPVHGIRRVSIRLKTGRNVVIVNPPGIEPVLQRRTPAAMAEHAAIPDTFQRWDFVVARPAACLAGESRIGADGERQDSVFACGITRRRETLCRSKFVICVEWRGVAAGAALAFEDLPAACGATRRESWAHGSSNFGTNLPIVDHSLIESWSRPRLCLCSPKPPVDHVYGALAASARQAGENRPNRSRILNEHPQLRAAIYR